MTDPVHGNRGPRADRARPPAPAPAAQPRSDAQVTAPTPVPTDEARFPVVTAEPVVEALGVAESALQFPHALVPPPLFQFHDGLRRADVEVHLPFDALVPASSRSALSQARDLVPQGLFAGTSHELEVRDRELVLRVRGVSPDAWFRSAPLVELRGANGEDQTLALFSRHGLVREPEASVRGGLEALRAALADRRAQADTLRGYLRDPRSSPLHGKAVVDAEAAIPRAEREVKRLRPPVQAWFERADLARAAVLEHLRSAPNLAPELKAKVRELPPTDGLDAQAQVAALEGAGLLDVALQISAWRAHLPESQPFQDAVVTLEHARRALTVAEAALADQLPRWREFLAQAEASHPADEARIRSYEARLAPGFGSPVATEHAPYVKATGPRPLELFGTSPTAAFRVRETRFERARGSLLAWAKATGQPELGGPAELPLLVQALVTQRGELHTEAGRLGLQALVDAGLLGAFHRDVLELLARHVPATALEGVRVGYNGHATQAMYGNKHAFEAFGARELWMTSAPSSGSGLTGTLFDLQLFHSGGARRTAGSGDHREDVKASEALALAEIKRAADEAERTGEVVIVDKGGVVAKHPDPDLERQVQNGTLRFVSHNRDDVAALAKLTGAAVLSDLAHSRIKAFEARVLGEQYTLLGAKEARHRWPGTRLRDVPLYVVGAGLIGGELTRAMARLGLPPEQVCVVDPDPEVRQEAAARGFRTLAEPPDGTDRPERAVVWIATPEPFLDARTLQAFGQDTLFLPMSSGGKAVDAASLHAHCQVTSTPRARGEGDVPPSAETGAAEHFSDWELEADGAADGVRTRAFVPVEGFPLNLYEESWPDRFGITFAGILVAVLVAALHDAPGSHPLPVELEDALLALYLAHGLDQPRPLDPRTGSPEEREALIRDLLDLGTA